GEDRKAHDPDGLHREAVLDITRQGRGDARGQGVGSDRPLDGIHVDRVDRAKLGQRHVDDRQIDGDDRHAREHDHQHEPLVIEPPRALRLASRTLPWREVPRRAGWLPSSTRMRTGPSGTTLLKSPEPLFDGSSENVCAVAGVMASTLPGTSAPSASTCTETG